MRRKDTRRMMMAAMMMALACATASTAMAGLPGLSLSQENRTILIPGDGEGTVRIEVFAPDEPYPRERPRLNLCLVIDRSGSMADAGKLEYAKRAAHALIDRLAPDDVFSLVAYDHLVEVPVRAQQVEGREYLHRLVEGLYPRGQTFLSGGIEEGLRQARAGRRKGYVNRILLLSDGLANVGKVDRGSLAELAGEIREKEISLSTIGVGAEFDEDLLTRMAMTGGGNYYYLAQPGDILAALDREFHLASRVAASQVEIIIRLRRGCSLREILGVPWTREGDDYVIRLGDLSAGEKRSLFARLRVDGEGLGSREAGEVSLRFRDPLEGKAVRSAGQTVAFQMVRDEAIHRQGFDQVVQAQRAVADANVKTQEAARLVDQGKKDEAKSVLAAAERELAAAPRPACAEPALQGALSANRAYFSSLDRLGEMSPGDVRVMQKGMKYRAYQDLKGQ